MKIEIELTDKQMKDIVLAYMGLNGQEAPSKPSANPGSGLSSEELSKRRQWLRENGYRVADQGRIAKKLLKIYDDAHSSS